MAINYKQIVKDNMDTIQKTNKTLKDIYSVIVSHGDNIAYERLIDLALEEVSFISFDTQVKAFASYIKNLYPDTNDQFVGIDLANSPDFLIAFWGVLMSGNKPYLINSYYPLEVKMKLLNRLKSKLVITAATEYTDFTVINMDGYDKDCPPITDELWANSFALSSTLTGLEAKMCVFEGEAVVNQIINAKGILKRNKWLMHDYEDRIKVIMVLPLFHIFGIMVSYFWFAFFGRTMVFLKDNAPETVRATINRHKVTHIFAPPILFHKLYKGIMQGLSQESKKKNKKFRLGIKIASALQNMCPSFGLKVSRKLFKEVLNASFGPSPRFMISGGAHIEKDALKIINCLGYPLFNGYGTTETAITGANLAKKFKKRINGSIGDPFDSVTYTFEEDGALVVSGSSLCKKIIMLKDELEESGFDSIKTNDLVKIVDGQYYIAGRKSDLFIGESGENISPDTIQNELEVKNANKFVVLELDGRLSIVLEYGERLPLAVINKEIASIKTRLGEVAYGQYINDIFVCYQPIANPNAIKVSRALVRRKVKEGEIVLVDYKKLIENRDKAMNESEDDAAMVSIKQTFNYALDTDKEIRSDANFFIDLGGTSLDYVALISELENIFNIKINLEKNQNLRTPQCFYDYINGQLQ